MIAGLGCEFAKMRRLRVVPVALVLVAGVVALSATAFTAPDFAALVDDPAGWPWQRLLAGLCFAFGLVSPILVAVVASRQVALEHQGNGWLFAHTAGLPPGRLLRSKVVATGVVLALATVAGSLVVAVVGAVAGVTVPFPDGQWIGYTASVVVVNLVLLVLHVLLAGWVENQLVGLGVGVFGVFVAAITPGLPRWTAHLTPWGHYTLAAPVDYRDGAPVAITPAHAGIAVLGIVGAAVLVLVTRRFDRQEA